MQAAGLIILLTIFLLNRVEINIPTKLCLCRLVISTQFWIRILTPSREENIKTEVVLMTFSILTSTMSSSNKSQNP